MTAYAGTFFFDGRPVESVRAATAASLKAWAGADEVVAHAADGIAMAQAESDVWPGDSSSTRQIRSSAAIVASWDGRLDNRDDLLLQLGDRVGRDAGDAAFVVAAYDCWGVAGLERLIGEWSAAIWDGARRVLHLARDYMGVRPLYYLVDHQSLSWSTSLGELAQRRRRTDALDDEFVARFITLLFSSDVTPYRGIRIVPAATCVSFAASAVETRHPLWQVGSDLVRFRDRRAYEERLRELWQEAVGSRLRTNGTVWAELSGGLDSSSVVCMADHLIKGGEVRARAIQPISHATLRTPEGDERRFIAEVERRVGVSSVILGVEDHQHLTDERLDWVTPLMTRGVGLATAKYVHEHGGRVLLSGRVGDVVMGCEPDNSAAVFDDLAAWRVLPALGNIRRWCRASRKPFAEILSQLVRQARSGGTLQALRLRSRETREGGMTLLADRLRPLAHDKDDELARQLANVRASKRDMAALVLGYAVGSRLNIPHVPYPIVYTYPFTHRPLVEFVLAIPGEELSAPGEMRSLMRRAFAGLVPARVLARTSKGYYPPAAMRGIRAEAASMRPTGRLEVVRREWIDPRRLDDAIRAFVDGAGGMGGEVQRVLRIEQWLASRNRRAPVAIPQQKEVSSHEVLNA